MYDKLIERLKKEEGKVNIGLFTHKKPDLDAVCSTLTLGNYIQTELGDKINLFPILDNYMFNLEIKSDLTTYDESLDILLDYAIILDVNETDRVYGISLVENVNKENRYLYDHHTGNRVELEVDDSKKIIIPGASSTCEVLGLDLLQTRPITDFNAYNLYVGITSDTAGFTRQVGPLTDKITKLLPISKEAMEKIKNQIIALTPTQKELYDRIEEEQSCFDNLKLYRLRLALDEANKMQELKNKFIEEKITPQDLDTIAILIIECGNNVFLKIRKNEKSSEDILTLAEKCNGGGHSNRTAGRFYDTSYEKVLSIINDYFTKLENNHHQIKLSKTIANHNITK